MSRRNIGSSTIVKKKIRRGSRRGRLLTFMKVIHVPDLKNFVLFDNKKVV